MFDDKQEQKDRLLDEILADGTGPFGYLVVWRTRPDEKTILLSELANENLVKRDSRFGARAKLTELGIDVATKFGGYKKWKKGCAIIAAETERQKKQDDEFKTFQLNKLKFDYNNRYLSVLAILVSLLSLYLTVYFHYNK